MFIEDSSLILQNTQNYQFHFWQKNIGVNGLLKNNKNDVFDYVLFVFVLQRTE